jgi:hypothetical protein
VLQSAFGVLFGRCQPGFRENFDCLLLPLDRLLESAEFRVRGGEGFLKLGLHAQLPHPLAFVQLQPRTLVQPAVKQAAVRQPESQPDDVGQLGI